MNTQPVHDVIIIGSGMGAYTAAIYTARAELNPLVFEGTSFGGALMTTTQPNELGLVGMHGSLTPAELPVPVLVG